MMQPIVPRHVYYWVYGALLALTLLTVGVAFLDLGPSNHHPRPWHRHL